MPSHRPGPPGGKREQNRRRRVQELTSAALELFLQDGIAGVTVDRITTAAGTSKGNFYRYFGDKEELVATLFAPLREGFEAALDRSEEVLSAARDHDELVAGYRLLGVSLGALLFAHSGVVRLYLQEARAPAVGARRPVRVLSDLVARRSITLTDVARENGLLRTVDPRVSALAVVGAVERMLWASLTGEHTFDPLQTAEALIAIVMDGLRPTTPAM